MLWQVRAKLRPAMELTYLSLPNESSQAAGASEIAQEWIPKLERSRKATKSAGIPQGDGLMRRDRKCRVTMAGGEDLEFVKNPTLSA